MKFICQTIFCFFAAHSKFVQNVMASGRKSRTAMDVLRSDLDHISTYSKKIDEMLSKIPKKRDFQ